MRQLTFEGIDVGSLRCSLQAVHFTGDAPRKLGEEVEFTIRARVDEIRFPFGTVGEDGHKGAESRTEIYKVMSVEEVKEKSAEDAA